MSDHRAALSKYVDKADAWDAICKKNEQIADLREQLATAQAAYLQFREGYEARLAKATAALDGARQSLALADKMLSEHIEQYHDFDYEPHQVPPELSSLRMIEHHLMGSLILDEDIAALKDTQP